MYYRFILPLTLLLLACNGKEKQKEENEDEQYAKIEQQDEKTIVKVQVAREDRFNLELVSNGKAEANRKAALNFEVADVVRKVNVKNGDRVKKGDIIAEVDDEKAKFALEDARLSLQKAFLDLKLAIINEGFKTLDDTATQRSHVLAMRLHVQRESLRKSTKRVHPRKNQSPF